MPWLGLEPTIEAFEGAKTIHALDRAATVIGGFVSSCGLFKDHNWYVTSNNGIN
jgi:hypothetical protein